MLMVAALTVAMRVPAMRPVDIRGFKIAFHMWVDNINATGPSAFCATQNMEILERFLKEHLHLDLKPGSEMVIGTDSDEKNDWFNERWELLTNMD